VAYVLAAATGSLNKLPKIPVPVMGVWSNRDLFMVVRQMTGSRRHVSGPWRIKSQAGRRRRTGGR